MEATKVWTVHNVNHSSSWRVETNFFSSKIIFAVSSLIHHPINALKFPSRLFLNVGILSLWPFLFRQFLSIERFFKRPATGLLVDTIHWLILCDFLSSSLFVLIIMKKKHSVRLKHIVMEQCCKETDSRSALNIAGMDEIFFWALWGDLWVYCYNINQY